MCILSVGWTCCQPKRWLSSPVRRCSGWRAAAAWQQKYLMLAPGLHLGSGSSLEPRPQLTSASPSLNTLPAAWSPPPPPQLTSLPHQHTIISDITLTMESSHSSPLYSHITPGMSSGNATNELHSVRYAAEYIQRSNQLHLPEKQKFPLCMNV